MWKRLAVSADFFCEVIRLVYRAKGTPKPEASKVSDEEKAKATNGWRLLHHWSWPPGKQENGTFDGDVLKAWYEKVRQECETNGRLEVALLLTGEVLSTCFTSYSRDELQKNRVAASILDTEPLPEIRRGFVTRIFNSGGVNIVDSGKRERKLADQWRLRASVVEAEGYVSFGSALRGFADQYDRDAERWEKESVTDV